MQGLWRRKSKKRGPKGVMPAVQLSATTTLVLCFLASKQPGCRVEGSSRVRNCSALCSPEHILRECTFMKLGHGRIGADST
jgi:hypothetical protein